MDVLSFLRQLSASLSLSRHVARDGNPPWFYPLSKREADLAELIAAGSTNLEIATRMGYPKRAIDGRVAVIMRKLALRKRAEIAEWVTRHRPT